MCGNKRNKSCQRKKTLSRVSPSFLSSSSISLEKSWHQKIKNKINRKNRDESKHLCFCFCSTPGQSHGNLGKTFLATVSLYQFTDWTVKSWKNEIVLQKKSKILPIITLNIIKLFYLTFIYVSVKFFLKKLLLYMIFFSSIFPLHFIIY